MKDCDLLQCVNRGLSSFGSNMIRATYSALGMEEDTCSTEILSDPEALLQAMKEVFGEGYVFTERSIIQEIKKKFDLKSSASSYTIPDAFKIACAEIANRSDEC